MDQGLKERLVGAAVLVAIGVWLIPWVLDGPENPIDSGTASLQLPAAEEPVPMRTQTLRLGEAAEPLTPPAAAPTPVEPPAEAVAEEPPAEATPPAPEPAPERVAAAPVQAEKPAPTPAATKPAAKPASGVAPTTAGGDWVVQLGSFGEESNAKRLAQRASTFGYKAEISSYRASGRTMYRVRVGPYATRGQADAVSSALGAHGFVAQSVAAD